MKKLKFLVLIITLCSITLSNAQNPVWTLPPKYIDQSGILQNLPTVHYLGTPALNTHNAMVDENGDLLFFIVDNVLYTIDAPGYNSAAFEIETDPELMGTEVVIVPFLDDCEKYYLFYYGSIWGTSGRVPKYAIFDLDISSTIGDLDGPYDIATIPHNPSELNFTSETYQGEYYTVGSTDVNSNGDRFVFFQMNFSIAVYKVNTTGINYVTTIAMPNPKDYTGSRSELEVVELSDRYRLAYSYRTTFNVPPTVTAHAIVDYVDIDKNTGYMIPSTGNSVFYPDDNNEPISNRVYIHGLEFSPDGNFLYITHDKTTLSPSSIDVYQINSSNPPAAVSNIPAIEAEDFQNSQIEYKDGKMHFVNGDRIATYDITTNQWNNNAVSFTSYGFSYNLVQTSWEPYTTFQLIDQIDGMDYNALGEIPITITGDDEICEGESTTLTASSIVPGVTYEWVETNNPGNVIGTGSSITVSPTTNTSYTVYGSINDCDGQDEITITVNPKPTVSLSNVTLCEGDNFPVVLNAGPAKGKTYSWTYNGTPVSGTTAVGTFNGPNASVNLEGTYCVTATQNSTGCSTDTCIEVQYDDRIDNTADFTVTDVSCNEPNNEIYIEIVFPAYVGYNPSPSNITTVLVLLKYNGISYVSDAINNPNFTTSTNTTYYTNEGVSANLNWTLIEGESYKIVRILTFPDGCVNNKQHVSGPIECLGGGRFANIESRDLTSKELEAIQNITISSLEISLQPNPTSGNVTINLSNNVGNEIIELIDYSGKVVLTEKMNTAKQTIDVNHLANGVYFVKVISGNHVKVEKLIKQ